MRALVTGVAGFIGSHLADALLRSDHEVVGVDRFSDHYSEALKRANLVAARSHDRFELREEDLARTEIRALVEGVDVIFHLAAQPGVRQSWGSQFSTYQSDNVLATQRLLESVARDGGDPRVVFSSSSSIYGNAPRYPTTEEDLPRPHSPYGITKLAAEHLCGVYATNFGVRTVSLRYFTVYGPRQRPDMAFHRLFEASLGGPPFPMFGDGSQIRDFTFVDDAVRANLAAAASDVVPGSCFNVAGGSQISMADAIATVQGLVGRDVQIVQKDSKPGDVGRTGGSVERTRSVLDWEPVVPLHEGLARQLDHHRATADLAR